MYEKHPLREQEPAHRRIYIAGKLQRAEAIDDLYQQLEAYGHEITLKWTELDEFPRPYIDYIESWAPQAEKMIAAAHEADTFILLNRGELKGALVELGAFLANQSKREAFIVAPQERQSVFFAHPCVTTFNNEQELLEFFEDETTPTSL